MPPEITGYHWRYYALMNYETRYCAFVDVLGFQNLLRTMIPDKIRKILVSVRKLPLAQGRERLPLRQSDLKFHSARAVRRGMAGGSAK